MTDDEIETYMPVIQAVARKYYYDHNTADDATQRTLMTLLTIWHKHNPALGPRIAWVKAIAYNSCVRHHRRVPVHRTCAAEPLTYDREPPEDLAKLAQTSLNVKLTRRQKKIIEMIFRYEYTCTEIAAITGKSRQVINNDMLKLGIRVQDINPRRKGFHHERQGS